MARFLAHLRRTGKLNALIIAVFLVGVLFGTVYATSYANKPFTAYAHGHQNGAFGAINQGDFANHSFSFCPGDPAASWPAGSQITTPAVTMHDAGNVPYNRTTFRRRDTGDPGCTVANYWVDIYFGHFIYPGNPCQCPGSATTNVYCVTASSNSCSDTYSFSHSWTYTGP